MSKSWRLNERHYGALQGLNKAETAAKHGDAQIKIWRRSYDIPPPPLDAGRPAASVARSALRGPVAGRACRRPNRSRTRSRASCRTGTDTIAPAIRAGQRVLIAAHGNSLRALVKYLDGISDAGDRRAEHPDRDSAGLRARREL